MIGNTNNEYCKHPLNRKDKVKYMNYIRELSGNELENIMRSYHYYDISQDGGLINGCSIRGV